MSRAAKSQSYIFNIQYRKTHVKKAKHEHNSPLSLKKQQPPDSLKSGG